MLKLQKPVQVGTASNWVAVAAGYNNHGLALRRDGSLWRGLDYTNNPPVFVQAGAETNWTSIASSEGSCFALHRDGTIWRWNEAVPAQVPMPSGGSRITDLRVSYHLRVRSAWGTHFVVMRADHSLWSSASLGVSESADGQPGPELVFAEVPAASNCVAFADCNSHTVIVKPDGTLWAWAKRGLRKDKDGSLRLMADPDQVGHGTNWINVAAGRLRTYGLQRDGSVWVWKHLFSTSRSDTSSNLETMTDEQPHRIGRITGVRTVVCSQDMDDAAVALDREGTLWTWDEEHPPANIWASANWGPPPE
jgi:alpha-tubulin suppressor-like RCC1 family protein